MSEANMHKYFLNTLWEFTRGEKEDRGSFIQKALKRCQSCKVKYLKTPPSLLLQQEDGIQYFYKDM